MKKKPVNSSMPENSLSAQQIKLITTKQAAAHKYDHGHCVIWGGRVMTGAAALAAMAALRIGAGLVSIIAHPENLYIYKSISPSLLVEPILEAARFRDHFADPRRNVVVIGPGAGTENGAALKKAVFDAVSLEAQKFCVLDADALTIFADDPPLLYRAIHQGWGAQKQGGSNSSTEGSPIGPRCVLTPHEGEFKKLFPTIDSSLSKMERAVEAAKLSGAIVVLKGAGSVIAAPDGRAVVNNTGTGWLATAGSGDVLAGIIAGLLARDILPMFEGVCAAVFLHGRLAELHGPGLISEDLPNLIPALLEDLN